MKILYIDHYAGSINMGMEFRPYYLSREWIKNKNEVRIIAADFSHLRKENPKIESDLEIENIDGIQYQWIKTNRYKGNGIKRAVSIFLFCAKILFYAKKIVNDFNPEVVIASSTYPLDTYCAQKISRLSGCKYIQENHDLWPLSLIEIGKMKKYNPFVVIMGIAEKSALKKSDHIVSIIPNEIEYMLGHGLKNKEKYTCIQNGICLQDWNSTEENDNINKMVIDLHNKGKFIICYLGGHAISNSLDSLIEAANNNTNNDVQFILIGNGPEKERLIKKTIKNNVLFFPAISKKEVPSVLSIMDALYIGATKHDIYKYGVSMNKVYDYMMAAKPIIYAVEAYNNDINKAKCGITIKPDSPREINKAIDELIKMEKSKREEMGINGKKFVIENYDYKKLANDFMSIINSLIRKNR